MVATAFAFPAVLIGHLSYTICSSIYWLTFGKEPFDRSCRTGRLALKLRLMPLYVAITLAAVTLISMIALIIGYAIKGKPIF
jgi:hypothetical protein